MVEIRIAPRHRVMKRATVEYGVNKYDCTVRDISVTGAALEFSDLIRLLRMPEKFTLILPEDGLRLACRVVWHRHYRMGVAFD